MWRSAGFVVTFVCACTKPVASSPIAPAQPMVGAVPAIAPVAAAPEARCVSGPPGRLELLPGDATFLVGVDLAALTASQVFRDHHQSLGADTKAFVDAAASCGIGYEDLQRVTFAFDTMGSGFAMVVTADGIGRADAFSCLRDAVPRPDGAAAWAKVADGERERYQLDASKAAWVVDECTVVVAEHKFVERVRPLLDGDGRSVLAGSLEPTIRRSNVTRHMWFAGVVPPEFVMGPPSTGHVDISGSVDLSSGISFASSLGFADATVASTKAAELRKMFDGSKSAFTGMGVPVAVVDRIRIGAHGPMLTIDASVTAEELATIVAMLRKM